MRRRTLITLITCGLLCLTIVGCSKESTTDDHLEGGVQEPIQEDAKEDSIVKLKLWGAEQDQELLYMMVDSF